MLFMCTLKDQTEPVLFTIPHSWPWVTCSEECKFTRNYALLICMHVSEKCLKDVPTSVEIVREK